jgi:Tol biopolymer transport system component
MKRRPWQIVLLLVAAIVVHAAVTSAQSGHDLFQQGLAKERGEGNLDAAIQLYQRVVKEAGPDRALAAQALIQIGGCYEKLGKPDAKTTYEQVVREYSDQLSMVTAARARLAAMATAAKPAASASSPTTVVEATLTTASLWGGVVSPDGKYALTGALQAPPRWAGPYFNLAVRNIATGEVRWLDGNFGPKAGLSPGQAVTPALIAQYPAAIPPAERVGIGAFVWSPDGKSVAYGKSYPTTPGAPWDFELRIIGTDGTGGRILVPRSKVVPEPLDWSPDGQTLAVSFSGSPTPEETRYGLVTVADGSVRDLKTFKSADLEWCKDSTQFSPDGKYFGYSLGTHDEPCDVLALATDGSGERQIIHHPANDHFVGWTPSGSVLFTSDRSGSVDLWLAHVAEGQVDGLPERLRSNVGSFWARGMTPAGALYFQSPGPQRLQGGGGFDWNPPRADVYVAKLDPTTGMILSAPALVTQRNPGRNHRPTWSADGRFLTYVSRDPRALVWDTITILSLETGEERVVRAAISTSMAPAGAPWLSADGRSVYALVTGGGNGRYLSQIDVATGATTQLGAKGALEIVLLRNGKDVAYLSGPAQVGARRTLSIFNLDTRTDRTVLEVPDGTTLTSLAASPDGTQVTYRQNAGGVTRIMVATLADGQAREIYQSRGTATTQRSTWSPDGKYIYFVERADNDVAATDIREELWRAPVAGGPAQKVGLSTKGFSIWTPNIHPEGKYIAFAEEHYGDPTEWVLDHFLPAIELHRPVAPGVR